MPPYEFEPMSFTLTPEPEPDWEPVRPGWAPPDMEFAPEVVRRSSPQPAPPMSDADFFRRFTPAPEEYLQGQPMSDADFLQRFTPAPEEYVNPAGAPRPGAPQFTFEPDVVERSRPKKAPGKKGAHYDFSPTELFLSAGEQDMRRSGFGEGAPLDAPPPAPTAPVQAQRAPVDDPTEKAYRIAMSRPLGT